jgi:hypothetical protein
LAFDVIFWTFDARSVLLVIGRLHFLVVVSPNFPLGFALAGTFFGGLPFGLLTAISVLFKYDSIESSQ